MNYDDFSDVSPGALVLTLHGANAFVPNPLPPEIEYNETLTLALAQATGYIGELKGACRRLHNPYLIVRPLQRLEAQTSSAMEGTHTTAENLALVEAGVQPQGDDSAREVSNYITSLASAVESIRELPVTHRTLKEAHRQLLTNVGHLRGENKLPGEFKRDQNMIGGLTLDTARFIPPPPDRTADCISQLEHFLNRDRPMGSELIDMALVHYQFETIHPFADGNGRVGRMLISLMAISTGLLDAPALYLSPSFEARKPEYIEKMYRVSAFNEWSNWLMFFLEIVCSSCEKTIRTIDKVIELQAQYKGLASQVSTSANLQSIIDMLFESPVIRPRNIVQELGITDAAARALLGKLVDLGIVAEFTQVYPRAWVAFELINVSKPDGT